MLELAFESLSRKEFSRSTPKSSRASCTVLPAYCITWTVSIPESSSKNQPQLVYMSISCLSASITFIIEVVSDRLRPRPHISRETPQSFPLTGQGPPRYIHPLPSRGASDTLSSFLRREKISRPSASRGPRGAGAPLLGPTVISACIAAAITSPSFDAMDTAPGGVFIYLHLHRWWIIFKVFSIIREFCQAIGFDMVQGVGQGHVSEFVVMPIRLAVSGYREDLGPLSEI